MSYSGNWYWENKFSALEYQREYRLANIETVKERERQQRIKHKEARNAYCREYYRKNRERLLAKQNSSYDAGRRKLLLSYYHDIVLTNRLLKTIKNIVYCPRCRKLIAPPLTKQAIRKHRMEYHRI